jgi:hypothetical protein
VPEGGCGTLELIDLLLQKQAHAQLAKTTREFAAIPGTTASEYVRMGTCMVRAIIFAENDRKLEEVPRREATSQYVDLATRYYKNAIAIQTEDITPWYGLIMLSAYMQDEPKQTERMLDMNNQFIKNNASHTSIYWTGRARYLTPNSKTDAKLLSQLLQKSMGSPTYQELCVLAGLQYRDKQYEAALKTLDRANFRHGAGGTAVDHCLRCLICKDLKRLDDSKAAFARAQYWLQVTQSGKREDPVYPFPFNHWVWLELKLILSECDQAIR